MSNPSLILVGYGVFLLLVLVVNLLYFFQVFKYRLPGDASLIVLGIHVALMLAVLFVGSTFINF